MGRSLKLIAVLAFATLAVTACGKRGALEPPGLAEGTPKKESTANTNSAKPAKDKMVHAKSEDEQEHREFVLDGLLR